jgi:hypothetical protein
MKKKKRKRKEKRKRTKYQEDCRVKSGTSAKPLPVVLAAASWD